jgi:hypothetical protein
LRHVGGRGGKGMILFAALSNSVPAWV